MGGTVAGWLKDRLLKAVSWGSSQLAIHGHYYSHIMLPRPGPADGSYIAYVVSVVDDCTK